MRGQNALIAMRRERMKPSVVFVDTDAGPQGLPAWAQWHRVDRRLCNLDVEPADAIMRIDWRPCVGLVVHVSGTKPNRVRAVASAIAEAGAKRVISSCVQSMGHGEMARFETLWVEDTEGHFIVAEQ